MHSLIHSIVIMFLLPPLSPADPMLSFLLFVPAAIVAKEHAIPGSLNS